MPSSTRYVGASDAAEVVGRGFKFYRVSIGGSGGWDMVCIKEENFRYEYKPDKWIWLDVLAPGRYIVKYKTKEDADRIYKLETAFTVE